MGNAIKQGTTDVSKWNEKVKKRWKNGRIKELEANKEDATKEEIKNINSEIEELGKL